MYIKAISHSSRVTFFIVMLGPSGQKTSVQESFERKIRKRCGQFKIRCISDPSLEISFKPNGA